MKLKLISMLAGAIALTVAATPLTVKAEPNSPSQPVPGQTPNRPSAVIQLTPQQQSQLMEIRRDTRDRIGKLLTSDQQNRLKAAVQAGKNQQAAFAAMNLSPQQQSQLQTILEAAQHRTEAILTPQQRQQIQQSIQKRQGNR